MTTTEPTQRVVSFDNRETRDDEMQTTAEEWISDLIADTEDAHNSEAFQQWLDIQRRFHDYSTQNSLLIALQCPHATHVAGYRTWQDEFDRQVSKGKSAIWIWAPITAKTCPVCGETKSRHDDECTSDGVPYDDWSTALLSFKSVPVFDVSQTESEASSTKPQTSTIRRSPPHSHTAVTASVTSVS